MRAQLADELIQLSPAEKRALGEALIASAEADADGPHQLTDAQRTELRARLAHHRANPGEPGVTLQELKTKLLGARA
ncbi:MAG: addiction module protein [Roseateles sp.]|uniref:addiction module protein n=1 Tax=Roseateles sp. TaxID=1971397 RepID=UPI0039EB9C14